MYNIFISTYNVISKLQLSNYLVSILLNIVNILTFDDRESQYDDLLPITYLNKQGFINHFFIVGTGLLMPLGTVNIFIADNSIFIIIKFSINYISNNMFLFLFYVFLRYLRKVCNKLILGNVTEQVKIDDMIDDMINIGCIAYSVGRTQVNT